MIEPSRIRLKIGDVFFVEIDNNFKRYFQYVAQDHYQLSSHVIRVFKTNFPLDANPLIADIVKDEIDFYTHTIIKWGTSRGYWAKIGNSSEIGGLNNYIFKSTADFYRKRGEPLVEVSDKWFVWKLGDALATKVGKLPVELQNSETGSVYQPNDIIFRIQNGKYEGFFPK